MTDPALLQPPSPDDQEVDQLEDDAPTPRATSPALIPATFPTPSEPEATDTPGATQDITQDHPDNLASVPRPPTFIDDPTMYPNRMPPPPPPMRNYYPDSAFGPRGPRSTEFGVRAAEDTRDLAATGFFNPPSAPSPGQFSSTRGSTSPPATTRSPPPPGGPNGPQFFSSPPMPVYHQEPQSVISYYPAPHHQAQILAQARLGGGVHVQSQHAAASAGRPTSVPPPTDVNLDPTLRDSPQPQPAEPAAAPPHRFIQGGVIYTPVTSELGLHSLSDGAPNEKPPYPYPTIIRLAILGSPRQRLTLSEIYLAMESRYPWFKTAGQGWKNSVRHNLSLNKCFAKVSRPITEPGKGAYWTVDLAAGEGNKRPRKRNKRPKKSALPPDTAGGYRTREASIDLDEDDEDDEDDTTTDDTAESEVGGPVVSRGGYSYPPPARNHAHMPHPTANGSGRVRPRPRSQVAAGGRHQAGRGREANGESWDSD